MAAGLVAPPGLLPAAEPKAKAKPRTPAGAGRYVPCSVPPASTMAQERSEVPLRREFGEEGPGRVAGSEEPGG